MFSGRTAWPRGQNRLAVAAENARKKDERLLDLTISNPTSVDLPQGDAVSRALANTQTAIGTYEPAPLGSRTAREAVAAYYARRGLSVQPDRIILTATTSEAYMFLFRVLADPGDAVAIPTPSYPLFTFLADLADLRVRPYHLQYDERWRVDLDSLRDAVADPTRAIVTVSPNNPTGSCLDDDEAGQTIRLAGDRLALISDEVFLDYLDGPGSFATQSLIGTRNALTFSLSGLSKVAGLPQMKLSWIVVSGPDDLVAEATSRLEIVADTFLSVSTPVQLALPDLIEEAESWQDRLRARLSANRTFAQSALGASPCRVRSIDGGWYLIIDMPRARDDEAWALDLLERDGVLAHPGFLFDLEDSSCLIVSLITRPEIFREGLDRLVDSSRRV